MNTLGLICLALAVLPMSLVLMNLMLYRRTPRSTGQGARVSILIPARNEAHQIRPAVQAALASTEVDLEVIVLDDGSTDATASMVNEMTKDDSRVRLIHGTPLPSGWIGKVHACSCLAEAARGEWLLFVDADVLISRDAASRLVSYAKSRHVDLVSGIPRQVTLTLGERLVIPLIHLVLLGYLPMIGMRLSSHPAFAAGIGQLMLVNAEAYRQAGGHAAIRSEIQDGVALPRLFRLSSRRTDLVDVTDIARCRMYDSFESVWGGFAKNAHAGMGSPSAIAVWTTLLLGAHVLPWVILIVQASGQPQVAPTVMLTCAVSMATRALLAMRFGQHWISVFLHPLGVLLIVAIQWYGLTRWLLRKPVAWKGRLPS